MVVELEIADDICIVRLKGRFSTGLDKTYLRDKTEEIKASGRSRIMVDFSSVSYIDSTGLGFLIGIYTSIVRNHNGMFVLANTNPRVKEVLQLTRLISVFPLYPDETSALEALRQGRKAAAPQGG